MNGHLEQKKRKESRKPQNTTGFNESKSANQPIKCNTNYAKKKNKGKKNLNECKQILHIS